MNTIAYLSRDELLRILRRLEPALRAKGVIELAMFGSRARGDHRPDSDVDLLVAVKSGIKFSLLDLVGVSHIISDEIGVPANLFMKRSLDPTMAATIRADLLEVF
jgi:predicted nucleotidyltransferase